MKPKTKFIQVSNIAPQATKDQISQLFGYIGKVEDIRLYPTIRDVAIPVPNRICYLKFYDRENVGVAQHLTNTVFIDRALVIIPYEKNEMPDEKTALEIMNSYNNMPGLAPNARWPPHITNVIEGIILRTIDPYLAEKRLPEYPNLPATTETIKVNDIRRTVYVDNIDPKATTEEILDFIEEAGMVKYLRMGTEENGVLNCLIEFAELRSIVNALQLHGKEFMGKLIRINHSTAAIIKPQTKNNDSALREIEDSMMRVKEAQQSLYNSNLDPLSFLESATKPRKSRSRSRSRSRSKRHRSVSRKRSKSRSKKKSRSSSRSRKRGGRSRSRKRSKSRSSRSHRRSRSRRRSRSHRRSRSRKRSRSKSRSRRDKRDKKDRDKKEERDKKTEEDSKEGSSSPEKKDEVEVVDERNGHEVTSKVHSGKDKDKKDKRSRSKKSRSRSRSREKKRKSRSRSKSKERRRKSRSRSRSRDRKSKKNRRSRSRSRSRSRTRRDKRRSRSSDRKRRSRSPKASKSSHRDRSRSRDRKDRDKKDKHKDRKEEKRKETPVTRNYDEEDEMYSESRKSAHTKDEPSESAVDMDISD